MNLRLHGTRCPSSSRMSWAKVSLEADTRFFEGKNVQLPQRLEARPAAIPSPERFILMAFAMEEGATVATGHSQKV